MERVSIERDSKERWDLEGALRTHFGLTSFRPLQQEIIETVLAGQSAMAILPTGGGKSLCYQLPALLMSGVTVVISPLISLMKDQVDGLVERGISAVAINSQDTPFEGRAKLDRLARGEVKLAFVAPERLKNRFFLEACRQVSVSLLAVDEAHCVSQWGHDFRPDYRYIKDFHQAVGSPPLLALTATARPQVQEDVMQHLGIECAPVFRGSSDRPNLWFGVEHCKTVAEKRAKLVHLTRTTEGSVIIYVTSRKDARDLAVLLERELDEPVSAYHAGLPPTQRAAVQNRFMAGLVRVVVATNAFGMGIDKPDIRAVFHAGVPDSLEAYFQEVGRAGRDGLPSACTMVVLPGRDVKRREFLLEKEQSQQEQVDPLLNRIVALGEQGGGWLDVGEENSSLAMLLLSHLQGMSSAEVVQRTPEGLEIAMPRPLTAGHRRELHRRLSEHERQKRARFRQMRSYVYSEDRCLRQFLLRYFGDPPENLDENCCSVCHPRPLPQGLSLPAASKRNKGKGSTKSGRAAAAAALLSPDTPWHNRLFERLRVWRREKAAEMQVPAYVVFGDRDLSAIASAAPQTLDELAACRGIGPRKLAAYGDELLTMMRGLLTEANLAGNAASALESAQAEALPDEGEPKTTPRVSRKEMVARAGALFAQGKTVAEAAALLDRAKTTVWRYFLDWIATDETDAWKGAVRRVISPDDYRAIRAALQVETSGRLKPIYDRLEGRYTYNQIRVAQVVLEKRA